MTFWYPSHKRRLLCSFEGPRGLSPFSGGYGEGETPLPIPNRAVKPLSADGTWPARARESRTPPVLSSMGRPPGGPSCVLGALADAVDPERKSVAVVRGPGSGLLDRSRARQRLRGDGAGPPRSRRGPPSHRGPQERGTLRLSRGLRVVGGVARRLL